MASNPVKRFWTVEEPNPDKEAADATARHSMICLNLGAELRQALRKSNLQVYPSDICIKISKSKFVYPDLTVAPLKALSREKHHPVINKPVLVVEVISPETEIHDKVEKAEYYQSLPSVQAYLILEQDSVSAILYTRQDVGWLMRNYDGMDAIVPLESIGCNLALSEAYLNIEFEESNEE